MILKKKEKEKKGREKCVTLNKIRMLHIRYYQIRFTFFSKIKVLIRHLCFSVHVVYIHILYIYTHTPCACYVKFIEFKEIKVQLYLYFSTLHLLSS